MQVFFRNCTQILTKTQGKKFEDMFLVKIASKGTSLTYSDKNYEFKISPVKTLVELYDERFPVSKELNKGP